MQLRPYQTEALDAIFDFWAKGGGNPLVEMATGTGKSLVIGSIVQRLLAQYPDMRVLKLVHTRELVRQNADELLRIWPDAPIGINSAGLGRRDKDAQILFAGIQSLARQVDLIGARDLVIIDEAHLVPQSGAGQYRSTIDYLRNLYPDLCVCGFTATPYRLDSGRLDQGDDKIFDRIVYEYGIGRGVDDGFLSPLVSKAARKQLDVSRVAKRGGEFIPGALEAAINVDYITQAACDEIIERGKGRRAWMVFCAGVDHAYAVCKAMRKRGVTCSAITGSMSRGERDEVIAAFSNGETQCITNVNVLTTGFNVPQVELIAMLRPTLSTGLYVQMLGRGTRKADDKADCLVLDFSGNVRRHGPVDDVEISRGRGRVKEDDHNAAECPNCQSLVSKKKKICPSCGYQLIEEKTAEKRGPKHNETADDTVDVMRGKRGKTWTSITQITTAVHRKEGRPDSVKISYWCGFKFFNQYLTIEHPGYAGDRARMWWATVVGTHPPRSVAEAMARFDNERRIIQVTASKDQNGFTVVDGWRVMAPNASVWDVDANFRKTQSTTKDAA